MSKHGSGQRCAVKYCKNTNLKSNLSFFLFPKDVNRAERWAMLCGRDDLLQTVDTLHKTHRVCGAHFEQHMFLNDLRNRLQPHACPTICPTLEGSFSALGDHNYGVFNLPVIVQDIIPERVSKKPRLELAAVDEPKEYIPCKKIKILQNILLHPGPLQPRNLNIIEGGLVSPQPLVSPTSTQTETTLSSQTPRKQKMRKTIKELKSENNYLKSELEKKGDFMNSITLEQYKALTFKFCPSEELATFINEQLTHIQKLPRGRRYSDEFKQQCVQMYLLGPKLYKLKLTTAFCLPGPRILLNYINRHKVCAGMNANTFKFLKMKVDSFKPEEKVCILCIDEMAIKANLFYHIGDDEVVGFEDFGDYKSFKAAQNATVLMIRGIRSNWKQPLLFYFHHSTCPGSKLKEIVTSVVLKLNEIGLNVVTLVSDMGSNNIEMSKLFDVSAEKPYFMIDNTKIIYMFDSPHLLKATRNNLLQHKFIFDGQQACWDDIIKFYEHERNFNSRAAPKLTHSHIFPTNFEKMKVKFAAQVLSASVAAAINLYVRFQALPAEASGTSTFITMMDNLFDLFNSSTASQGKQFNRAFKALEYQISFLKNTYEFFEQLKIITKGGTDVTNRMKFINCWKININGLMQLYSILHDQKFEYILTRRINQDCLENFFGSIRQQNGNCVNPTPIQFQRSFKKICCIRLMYSGTENCDADEGHILLQMKDVPREDSAEKPTSEKSIIAVDTEYQTANIFQQNIIRYICGYLVKKCLAVHTCNACELYAKEHQNLDDSSLLCFFRAYQNTNRDSFGNLYMPNDNFVFYIAALEKKFEEIFEEIIIMKNVRMNFISRYSMVKFVHPCTNFPYIYLINLYSRMRVYFTLKFINRSFKSSRGRKQLIIWEHK